jgi:periplasmic divalent cation tolerance protein
MSCPYDKVVGILNLPGTKGKGSPAYKRTCPFGGSWAHETGIELLQEGIKMENPFIVVLITAPSLEVGQQVGRALVEQKLAACVNVLPGVQSLFRWEGEVSQEGEVMLVAKTRAALFEEQFIKAVKEVHPYEVPEIIALPIVMGSQDYLDWIGQETSAD